MKRVIPFAIVCIAIIIIDLILGFYIDRYKASVQWESRVHIWCQDTILGWVNKSDTSVTISTPEFQSTVSTDSYGYRYIPYEYKNDSSILFIGDSYLQGLEVSDSFTFTALIQKNTDYRIINAGVRGYGTDQEYLYAVNLLENIPNIKTVILIFYINDFYDILTDNTDSPSYDKAVFQCIDGKMKRRNFPVNGNQENQISPNIYTSNADETNVANIIYKSNIIELTARYFECSPFGNSMYRAGVFKTPQYMTRDWEIMNDTILQSSMVILNGLFDSISNLCDQKNVELKVVIIPYAMQYDNKMQTKLNQLRENYNYHPDYNAAMDTLVTMLNSKEIESIYPIDILKRKHDKQPIVYKYDEHFNKRGHEILSNIIIDMLFSRDSCK